MIVIVRSVICHGFGQGSKVEGIGHCLDVMVEESRRCKA